MDRLKRIVEPGPRLMWRATDLRAWWASLFGRPVRASTTETPAQPFLFIIGSGRSGNTLMRRLLMERSDLYIPPETYVLKRVADRRITGRGLKWSAFVELVMASFEYHPEFSTITTESLRDLADRSKDCRKCDRSVQTLLLSYYQWLAQQTYEKTAWLGDKTPLNTLHMGRIAKLLPGAYYIYLLRDGADVTVSYKHAGIYQSMEAAARRWYESHRCWENFKTCIPPERRIEIRFEDFIRAPEETIHSIQKRFDIPARSEPLDLSLLLGDVPNRQHHSNVMNTPDSSAVGRGRRHLTPDQRRLLRPYLNRTLQNCDYPPL